MTQELGRIERPSAEDFRGRRKLLLVPLLYHPPALEEDGAAILSALWEQTRSQVTSLEAGDIPSAALVGECRHAGAVLEATEDPDVLRETLDLQRCLMLPFSSEKVAMQIREWFNDSVRRRYEHIATRIDESLGPDEVGLLIINERHQVQFQQGVDVFYVAPPALDQFRRWLDAWFARQRSEMEAQAD